MSLPKNDELIIFLQNLFDTNKDFANEHDVNFFQKFSNQQNPKLTILKCSDSRVQMESFDKTPQNGVFAIRNIGNQVITSEGSIDFGVEVLQTPFLLIIGHSNCGAIGAVIEQPDIKSSAIKRELSTLSIAKKENHLAVIENINNQVSYAIKKYKDRIMSNKLTVLGAIYDFKNDFGLGHGKVILTNVNQVNDPVIIQKEYSAIIANMNCLTHDSKFVAD